MDFISYKAYFFKTKIVYTGIFFLSYILYRWFGCAIIDYLCGQELGFFIPVFFIALYYILIGILKLTLRFFEIFGLNITEKGFARIDLFVEILFYLTTVLLLFCEQGNPYLFIIVLIVVLTDLAFAFFIFRKGIVRNTD